tara:strand:+ start:2052 stop:2270 length:219 start_codon:yes stop_codon:yes gene_type:complete
MPDPIEFGKLLVRLQNLEHRARNDRTIIHFLESEVERLRLDFERFKVKVATGIAVAGLFLSGIAWVIEARVF